MIAVPGAGAAYGDLEGGIDREATDPDGRNPSLSSTQPEEEPPAPPESNAVEDAAGHAPTFDGVDLHLLEQLRAKDEQAFAAFVGMHHRAMVRFAMQFVRSQASAEEVTQDTWLAALDGLDQFEGRSSVVSWIYAILINKAKSRGRRDSRDTANTRDVALPRAGEVSAAPGAGKSRAQAEEQWNEIDPERILAGREIRAIIDELVGGLPEPQRAVITLQDLQGQDAETVRSTLGLTEANRRVLLHRARARLRKQLRAILSAG